MSLRDHVVARRMLRNATFVLGWLVCFAGIWSAVPVGLSRRLSERGLSTGELADADNAVRINSNDPVAHYARARALIARNDLSAARASFEQAALLRPGDFRLWLELGKIRQDAGDQPAALAALDEAIRLAPFYARPRWEKGIALLNAGRREAAFLELRRAVDSYPALFSQATEIGWNVLHGDARECVRVLQPQTDKERISLALFLAQHDRVTEAVELHTQANVIDREDDSKFLHTLFHKREFRKAYDVWTLRTSVRDINTGRSPELTDGGFEKRDPKDEIGFDWQVANVQRGLRVGRDPSEVRQGAYSLRLDWNGGADYYDEVVWQYVPVEPNTEFVLNFSAKTARLVSASRPLISVVGVSLMDKQRIASQVLPAGDNDWFESDIRFKTGPDTRALHITLNREPCFARPCPIFGHVWFDAFSLRVNAGDRSAVTRVKPSNRN